MLLVVLSLCFCFVIIGLMGLIFEEDPATPKKTPTTVTPLMGDLCSKLCPRQEIYKIREITSEGMWLLPFCIDKKLICPPKWGYESKNLVWITMDEFNKHFEIL